jgi:cytochrome c-type biogenesis protein CcmH/NrfF
MSTKERVVRVAVILAALLIAALAYQDAPEARAQQLGEGMVRSGMVGIQNEAERKLFYSLLCTCGCPRETLGTCTCGFGHARRTELRAQLEEGLTMDQSHVHSGKRFGTQALAVPPNSGANRVVFLLPLAAALLGATGIFFSLRRWRRRSTEQDRVAAKAKPPAGTKLDDYDEKLDQELKDLDESGRDDQDADGDKGDDKE